MSQLCICGSSHQANLKVECNLMVYIWRHPGSSKDIRYWLLPGWRWNLLRCSEPDMVLRILNGSWLIPGHGWFQSCQLTVWHRTISNTHRPQYTHTTFITWYMADTSTFIHRFEQDAPTPNITNPGEGKRKWWDQCSHTFDRSWQEQICGWNQKFFPRRGQLNSSSAHREWGWNDAASTHWEMVRLITPALTKKAASTSPSTTTKNEISMTPKNSKNHKLKGTQNHYWPATHCYRNGDLDHYACENEEYVTSFLVELGVNRNQKTTLDYKTMMLAHHTWTMCNKINPIFQQALIEDPRLSRKPQTLGNKSWQPCMEWVRRMSDSILHMATSQTSELLRETERQKRSVAGESGYTRSENLFVFSLGLWISFWCVDSLWVYGFPLGWWIFIWDYAFPLGL